MEFTLKGKIENKVSKNGKPYEVLVINLGNNVEKYVYLSQAEITLLKLQKKLI